MHAAHITVLHIRAIVLLHLIIPVLVVIILIVFSLDGGHGGASGERVSEKLPRPTCGGQDHSAASLRGRAASSW